MKWLVALANEVNNALAPLIAAGLPPAHAMSGALAVVSVGDARLFQVTANYNPARGHVEPQLMAALFDWTRKAPFLLPAHCSVYLYVYNSPCEPCVTVLGRTRWMWANKNPTVTWYLSFTRYYAGQNSYANPMAANRAYTATGWRVIDPNAGPAAPPAAAAAAAGGGGGGGGGAAVAAPAPAVPAPAKRA